MEEAKRGLIAAQPLLLQQRGLARRRGKGVGSDAARKLLALACPHLGEEGAAVDGRRQGAVAVHGCRALLRAKAALLGGLGCKPAAGGARKLDALLHSPPGAAWLGLVPLYTISKLV